VVAGGVVGWGGGWGVAGHGFGLGEHNNTTADFGKQRICCWAGGVSWFR
jgi:hypothetical protein